MLDKITVNQYFVTIR